MKVLQSINQKFYQIEKFLLVFLLLGMVSLSFLQVILRQFFSTGILWADVFLRHLVLWVGFLGAAAATGQDKHFAIDLVKKFLPGKFKTFANIAVNLFAVACLYHLSSASLRFFQDELASGSVLFTVAEQEIHSFWINAAIPGGFILLLIHFGLRLAQDLMEASGAGPEAGLEP